MMIKRRSAFGLLAGGWVLCFAGAFKVFAAPRPEIKVYKDPSCECCTAWVKHIQANGFATSVEIRNDLADLKRGLGVPDALTSCHTAIVGDYVLEGHVPAREISRLITQKPTALGLVVPGMPIGAPGMELPGQPANPFEVLLFAVDGSHQVFATYP